ncbi:MAG: MDR family MFS transporter, partial [Candidatus Limnocylindria bacterium]
MTAAAPVRDAPPVEIDHRTRLEILGAILLGLFLSALDQTVVGTALPRIVDDLQGNDLYTWVFTVYLLTSTVTGPIYGKLSDLFGRRPIIMLGIILFLVGSALSGLSGEMWQLILFRGIQGLGAGALFPVALAVIGDLFSPSERGKYQGLFGAVFGVSALIGPALGGLLTDTVGWPWVFFVNLPVGAVALFIIWRTLPAVRRPDAARSIDYLGAAVFTAAIIPILVGLTNKQFGEWTDPSVGGLIALGLLISALFVWSESRAREPIVPLGLFANRTFSISVAASFLAAFGFFGAVVFLPRWFQVVRGASATESGYQTLALLVGLIGSSVLSGQIVSRTGRYKLLMVVSLSLLAVGLFAMSHLQTDTPLPILWAWMLVTGLGIGPSFAILTLIVQNAVPFSALGAATSNLVFFRQVGGTVGLA